METVRVELAERSYDVRIGPALLAEAGAHILPLLNRPRVSIVTEERVAGLHLKALQTSLTAAGIESEALVLPAGESTKSWAHLTETVEWLLGQEVERKDVVVAFGGGVIGDLAGFAAAINTVAYGSAGVCPFFLFRGFEVIVECDVLLGKVVGRRKIDQRLIGLMGLAHLHRVVQVHR